MLPGEKVGFNVFFLSVSELKSIKEILCGISSVMQSKGLEVILYRHVAHAKLCGNSTGSWKGGAAVVSRCSCLMGML